MEMVKRTNTGPPVKSVVVFGDDVEYEDFCSRHRASCSDKDFHPLLLEDLLGSAAHAKLKRRLRLQYPPANFKYRKERFGCLAKSAGRIYQAVKKFYGVAYGPAECQTYWVSDAESLPFRKHNLTEHLALNSRSPRIVVSTWHDEPDCADVAADDGTDQACAIMMTNQSQLGCASEIVSVHLSINSTTEGMACALRTTMRCQSGRLDGGRESFTTWTNGGTMTVP